MSRISKTSRKLPNFIVKKTGKGWHFQIRQSRAGSRDWAWSSFRIFMVGLICASFFAVPVLGLMLIKHLFGAFISPQLMWIPALVLGGLSLVSLPWLLRRWKLHQSDWLKMELSLTELHIQGLEHRARGQVHALDRTWQLNDLQDERGPQIKLRTRTGSLLLGSGSSQVRIGGLYLFRSDDGRVLLDHLTQAIEHATSRHGRGQEELPDDLERIQERAKVPPK